MAGAPVPPTVAYVVTVDDLRPASSVLGQHADRLSTATAVQLCRDVPRSASPRELIATSSALPGHVTESWATTPAWFLGALHEVSPELASRLVVVIDWPIATEAETALLLSKLEHPTLRVAVRVSSDTGAEAFRYFNRLGLSWIAVPADGEIDTRWATLLRDLGRRWCRDAATVAIVEPIATGFKLALERRFRPARAWHCDIVAPAPCVGVPWSPTLHVWLTAMPRAPLAGPPDRLADIDRLWLGDLQDFSERIDLERLAAGAALHRHVPVEAVDDL